MISQSPPLGYYLSKIGHFRADIPTHHVSKSVESFLYLLPIFSSLHRIQELLLYKRLLSTHVVPTEKLDKAISLDER
jgi:hypothetical protein